MEGHVPVHSSQVVVLLDGSNKGIGLLASKSGHCTPMQQCWESKFFKGSRVKEVNTFRELKLLVGKNVNILF